MKASHGLLAIAAWLAAGAVVTAAPQARVIAADAPNPALTGPALLELRSYYRSASNDWALSSNPWSTPPGYSLQGSEGFIFSPDRAQPLSTVPLYTWYSPSRSDYFTTSNSTWAGSPGRTQDGYSFMRMEGYAHALDVAGTRRLELWWNGAITDNRTTTDPTLTAAPGSVDGYGRARVEGYVLPPSTPQAPETPSAFHWGTMGGGPRGGRDLLVLMLNYTGQAFRQTRSQLVDLFFGPDPPNIAGYFSEVSQGAFTWRAGDVVGPLTPRDDPDTTGNESAWRDVWDTTWNGFLYVGLRTRRGYHVRASGGGGSGADAGYKDFRSWETFGLADVNGGSLMDGDAVAFKTLTGHFIRNNNGVISADGTTKTSASARFDVIRVAGFGQVMPGDAATLKSEATGRYVVAAGGGGAGLEVTALGAGDDGVFTLLKGTSDADRMSREGVSQAAAAGFDFGRYDVDGDNLITSSELTLFVVGSGPVVSDYGQAQAITRSAIPGTQMSIEARSVPVMGEDFSLMTAAHELSHLLGTLDLYGATGLNGFLTVMSYTIFGIANDRETFHLDPWHKVRLGWVEPRIRALHQPGGSELLTAPGSTEAQELGDTRPLLLYQPSRYDLSTRLGEFFLVEYRSSWSRYDHDVAEGGVVVWLCAHDGTGHLVDIPSLTKKGGVDASCNTFAPPDGQRGGTRSWGSWNGAIALRWFDGDDAGVTLRVGHSGWGLAPHSLEVEWSAAGTLRPRIDGGSPSSFPGGSFNLDGMFPVGLGQTALTVGLQPVGASGAYPAAITSRSGTRLIATLPATIPIGSYTLWVSNDGLSSNLWPFEVDSTARKVRRRLNPH